MQYRSEGQLLPGDETARTGRRGPWAGYLTRVVRSERSGVSSVWHWLSAGRSVELLVVHTSEGPLFHLYSLTPNHPHSNLVTLFLLVENHLKKASHVHRLTISSDQVSYAIASALESIGFLLGIYRKSDKSYSGGLNA